MGNKTEVSEDIITSELIEKITKENEYLKALLELSVDCLFFYNAETHLWTLEKTKSETTFRINNMEEAVSSFDVTANSVVVHQEDVDKYNKYIEQLIGGNLYPEGRFRVQDQNGQWFYNDVKGVRITHKGQDYVIGTVSYMLATDETEKNNEVNEYELDPLTKLFNKGVATKRIAECISPDEPGALFILDVDNFKKVNDNLGHLFGDEVLSNVAKAIKKLFRYDDIVGRIGGDEFIVYMRNIDSVEEVEKRAQKVCEAIANIYIGEKKDFRISTSVGIVLVPRDGSEYKEVFEKADNAMYYSKNSGKNRYTIYDSKNKEIGHGGRNEKGGMIDYYTTFSENNKNEVNKFAYELIDFTFQIMEDTADMDSAINILLLKVQDGYKLSGVSIYTVNSEPNTLECIYEVSKNNFLDNIKTTRTYTKEEWRGIKSIFEEGYYIEERMYEGNGKTYKHLSIPMYAENKFIGYIDFLKSHSKGKFTTHEINTFKAFSKILSVYALSMRAFIETSKMLDRLNERDALTGLYKYDKFHQIIRNQIKDILVDKNILIAYSDINHFKVINETYGYSVGDKLLKAYARMTEDYGEVLCASRVYSDNIVCAIIVDKNLTDEDCIEGINQKNDAIQSKLGDSFFDNRIMINTGLYIVRDENEDIETAVTNANFSRKEAKNKKIRTAVMFDQNMMEALRKDVRLTSDLPRALENEEIMVFYQPKIECGSTSIVGGEALVRWVKPDGTMIYPDEFIPVFEKNGSIVEVDYYVYEQVFKYISDRLMNKKAIVPISLNVSRVHLMDNGFMNHIIMLFDKYQVPPEFIEFELTESIYIKNMKQALEFVNKIKKLGVRVSMDDFGSGYSSMNLINDLPIDVLKIDRDFMRHDELSPSDEIIVSSIINMAKKLRLKVLCEGVETKEQSEFLSRVGCDIIQGYLYSKPIPQEEFSRFIEEHLHGELNQIRFAFNDSLEDDSGKYKARFIGNNIKFIDGPIPGMKALRFPGGSIDKEVMEIPREVYVSRSYSIAMWIWEGDQNIWTSVFYSMFEDGFNSIMPRAWEMKASFRVKSDEALNEWFDAGLKDDFEPGWNHLVATYDAEKRTSTLYINGVRSGAVNNVPPLNMPRRVILGGDIYASSFIGKIADVRFYNVTLTAFEADNIYREVKNKMQ